MSSLESEKDCSSSRFQRKDSGTKNWRSEDFGAQSKKQASLKEMKSKSRCKVMRRPKKKRTADGCMRSGPITRNAFLNFMRYFRKKHCCLSPRESLRKGAEEWKNMNPECKEKYIKAAIRRSKAMARKRQQRKCAK